MSIHSFPITYKKPFDDISNLWPVIWSSDLGNLKKSYPSDPLWNLATEVIIIFSERRDNYVPEISALEDEGLLECDPITQAMVKGLDFENKDALLESLKCTDRTAWFRKLSE